MKCEMPGNHGLSNKCIEQLVFHEDGSPSLTDVQHSALAAGVGTGASVLVVSPTSTGKTQIALWAIANSIEARTNAVYLVTHRALAKQKFEEFKTALLTPFLNDNPGSIVLATGDYVEDAQGVVPADPLHSTVMVATYEKYLAMLSGSGVPADMTNTVIVCDEVQLIGDANRGQNVEVLLSLLKNSGWRQFVALSAVLESKDARELAAWLGVDIIIEPRREKHLRYECWTSAGIFAVSTEHPEELQEGLPIPKGVSSDPLAVVAHLLKQKPHPPVPIIVFCTRSKQSTYEHAERFIQHYLQPLKGQMTLAFDGIPETSANDFLKKALPHRIAVHSADLLDEEREVVERHLLEGKLDAVFATTTLAAGVNFPLGAAVFANWDRWNKAARMHEGIGTDEFHNMAGRVGRMGFDHDEGRVVLFSAAADFHKARVYLDLGTLPKLEARISPSRFDQLSLQLIASGLCSSRDEVERLICTTFSATKEQDRNTRAFDKWPATIAKAIDALVEQALVIETSRGGISATPIGKAIAFSGILPTTGVYLLSYLSQKSTMLADCLPSADSLGDMGKMVFLLFNICYSSPEFRQFPDSTPTRFLPWPLDRQILFDAEVYRDDLPEPVWHADLHPINGAHLTREWIEGGDLKALETSLPQLSAGMLREMFRNLGWVLQGMAAILDAASDTRVPNAMRRAALKGGDVGSLRKLPRVVRRLSHRVSEGLPDNVLWMTSLNTHGSDFRIFRHEILSLRHAGFFTPEQLALGSDNADKVRIEAFQSARPAPQAKANWLRDATREWKNNQREAAAERHARRTKRCVNAELVGDYYKSRGTDFENVFEKILQALEIPAIRLDVKMKTGAPDYLIQIPGSPPLVIELKSREGTALVDYNRAVEVLSASEVHGYGDSFCVTLCHPGVDPSVPLVIANCGRLSVVESHDLAEALVRVCEGTLSLAQFWQWLATPGQALSADLPFRA